MWTEMMMDRSVLQEKSTQCLTECVCVCLCICLCYCMWMSTEGWVQDLQYLWTGLGSWHVSINPGLPLSTFSTVHSIVTKMWYFGAKHKTHTFCCLILFIFYHEQWIFTYILHICSWNSHAHTHTHTHIITSYKHLPVGSANKTTLYVAVYTSLFLYYDWCEQWILPELCNLFLCF